MEKVVTQGVEKARQSADVTAECAGLSHHLTPGQVFARDFKVERLLSQGGMGAVYVVRQQSTDKLRALKVMHPQLVPDEKSRQRFVGEARVGARIESEHVVEVLAAGVDEETGVPWLAMELLDGVDLGDLSRHRGPLAAGEVRDAFAQLGHALGTAHAQGIVHRDLKPENLFLARSRREGRRRCSRCSTSASPRRSRRAQARR